MLTVIFALFFACTTSQDQPVPTNVAATVAPSPELAPMFTVEQSRALRDQLVRQFAPTIERITKHDSALGKQAGEMVAEIATLPLATMVDGRTIVAREPCEGDCAYLAFGNDTMPIIAGWRNESRMLIIREDVANNPFGTISVLHEMLHMAQGPGDPVPKWDYVLDLPVPRETQAHAFSRQLINAYGDGTYDKIIKRMADDILSGLPITMVNSVAFTPFPHELYQPFGPDGKPPPGSVVDGLLFQAMYDLNIELIVRTRTNADERARALDGLYANLTLALQDPRVQELGRNEMATNGARP